LNPLAVVGGGAPGPRSGYTLCMRVLAVGGFLLFAYLTIIPAGLVGATLDPACAGGNCESGLAARILLALLYGACSIALAGTAIAFAGYGLHPTANGLRLVARALAVSAAAIGLALFTLLAVSYPVAGIALAALAAGGYLWLRRMRPDRTVDPSTNGHGSELGGWR
jgi:hypothetical protein